jgi:GT2 family glycosyltransferase
MLFRLSRFDGVGFFDERFFLYYEDDDLCLRLFQARRPIVIWPAVAAVHRARGSVKGSRPWKSEYLRGYHHAQSKLIYTAKHRSMEQARRQRWRVLAGTTLALPVRAIAWSPRLLARMAGRWMGLLRWRHDA